MHYWFELIALAVSLSVTSTFIYYELKATKAEYRRAEVIRGR